MLGLEPGQRVHFVLREGQHRGECRAAMVVRVIDPATSNALLFVLTDGLEDDPYFYSSGVKLAAERDSEGRHGRWHFRSECPARRRARAAI